MLMRLKKAHRPVGKITKADRQLVDEFFGCTVTPSTVHHLTSFQGEIWDNDGNTITLTGWHGDRDGAIDEYYRIALPAARMKRAQMVPT